MADVLAVLEQRDGTLKRIAQETLTAGRVLADGLGGALHGLVIGPEGMSAEGLGAYGADKVVLVADEAVARYQPGLYVAAVAAQADAGDYGVVLLGATALGRDLAPRVAARLGVPFAADVTGLEHGDGIVVRRPVYSGKAIATLRVTTPRCVISLRPNQFTPEEVDRPGTVEPLPVPDGAASRETVVEIKAPERAALDVAEAPIVVSGGRGMRDPKHFALIEDLAAAFGGDAAVGASRAVVDAGWRPHAEQVGQTGKTVSPNLYVAVGISGAIQHLAGMKTAKTIVAINKDRDAPIFKVADYGIVGDLFEIVPRLTEEIEKVRGG